MTSCRHCQIDKDKFCYICGIYMAQERSYNILIITKLVEAYKKYFSLSLTADMSKSWAPKCSCGSCKAKLLAWPRGGKGQMPFSVPRGWRSPQNHVNDCYFCLIDIARYVSSKKKCKIIYPSINSSIAPVPFTNRKNALHVHYPRAA